MPKRLFDGEARRDPGMDLPLTEFSPPNNQAAPDSCAPALRVLEKVYGEEVSSEGNDR
jgi:hypothetical protein